jgi:hypothetical protein
LTFSSLPEYGFVFGNIIIILSLSALSTVIC